MELLWMIVVIGGLGVASHLGQKAWHRARAVPAEPAGRDLLDPKKSERAVWINDHMAGKVEEKGLLGVTPPDRVAKGEAQGAMVLVTADTAVFGYQPLSGLWGPPRVKDPIQRDGTVALPDWFQAKASAYRMLGGDFEVFSAKVLSVLREAGAEDVMRERARILELSEEDVSDDERLRRAGDILRELIEEDERWLGTGKGPNSATDPTFVEARQKRKDQRKEAVRAIDEDRSSVDAET